MKVSKAEEYFVYFTLLKPHSWGKRSAVSRRRFHQSFPQKDMEKEEGATHLPLLSAFWLTQPRQPRPDGHCRYRKPCRLCEAGGARRTSGKRRRRGSPVSSGSCVSYLFSRGILFSWVLPCGTPPWSKCPKAHYLLIYPVTAVKQQNGNRVPFCSRTALR